MLSSEKLQEAFFLVKLVYKDDLPPIEDHSMSGVTVQRQDCLMRVIFVQTVKVLRHFHTVFNSWLIESQEFIVTESKAIDNFLKVLTIVVYAW